MLGIGRCSPLLKVSACLKSLSCPLLRKSARICGNPGYSFSAPDALWSRGPTISICCIACLGTLSGPGTRGNLETNVNQNQWQSYFLGPHDVELEEVEGASVLLGVEGVVNHEKWARSPTCNWDRRNFARCSLDLHLSLILSVKHFLALFDYLVGKEIVLSVENGTSEYHNTYIYCDYISHLYYFKLSLI